MHFVSVGKNNYGPRIAPDRVSSSPTRFTGSVAMDFMPEHAPIDPIEEKLRAFRCKTTENRWVGYTQSHCKQQVKYNVSSHGVCPGAGTAGVAHTNPAPSCILMLVFYLYWVVWSMLGHKIHCRRPGKARGTTRNSIRCDPRLRFFFTTERKSPLRDP